jgi:retinol dehydrogenase-12
MLGKVHIVTGGYTGIGLALVKILYEKNGTIYVAGRDKAKFDKAIAELKTAIPSSEGRIEFLKLDLADQSTIKASADEFLAKESRLDVLIKQRWSHVAAGRLCRCPRPRPDDGY